jgi:hypothetical protein
MVAKERNKKVRIAVFDRETERVVLSSIYQYAGATLKLPLN